MSDTVLFFAIEQQKVRIITAFLKSFERGLGVFQNGMYVEGGRTHWKIRFYRIHYKNIIVRAPCDKDGAWINIKVIRKRNTSVEGLAGQEVELINTPTANLLCTFPTHWVSSRPETTATENLIMSLFDQLHFNNVSSDDLFHGDHLVM